TIRGRCPRSTGLPLGSVRRTRSAASGDRPRRRLDLGPMSEELHFRRPVEADHRRLVAQVDDWWGGRRLHPLFLRLWFQHFSGTSWIVEDAGGRLIGFL